MKFKPILKKAINGGMVASMLCMTFTPLSKMQLEPFDVYAAVREIHQFQQVKQYNNNFSDVGTSDWFYNSVAEAYKYDLVNGKSATKFDPKGNVTIAEVITMADKLHSYSTSGSLSPSIQMEAEPWYTLFVRYAETMQIISTGEFSGEYDRPATREELAHIFAHAIPDNGYQQINVVTTLPDIDSSNKYYNDVIKLYNSGIISGNDYRGTFTPKANITRAEAAAIASRLALPSTRIQLTFCKSIALPSEDNSFGELKKIGTEVISREERDRQRAEEQKQKEKEQAQREKEEQAQKEKEKEKEQSSNKSSSNSSSYGGTNGRYNYNYTWDYETNSPVDPDEVRRLQREHGYNTTTDDDDDDYRDSTSSNKTSSKEDRNDRDSSNKSSKYETDSRGYLTFDSFIDAVGYTQAEIDRMGSNEIRDYYENDYLRCMRAVSNTYSKNESSYEFRGKTYYDYYDFLYAVSIDFCNDGDVFERDGKIYFDREESQKASDKAHAEEEQWEIEHYAEETLKLVNEARAEEGLPALTLDPDLVEAAEIRAKELTEYYSHTRPDGSDSNTIIDEYSSYFFGTENIAKGTSTTPSITSWMGSSGHRAQILNEKYQYYGAATIRSDSGSTYSVQIFGGN